MKRAPVFALTAGALALALAAPLGVAVTVAGVSGPAVTDLIMTQPCRGAIPATGNWRPPFQQPYTLTSHFGDRVHPIDGDLRMHAGVDLVSQPTLGPVVATATGTVTFAGTRDGLGLSVDVLHGTEELTRYGHLADLAPGVEAGQPVWMGQPLGTEGSTGDSTGNHLHFEVHIAGEPVDPVPFMLARGAPLNGLPVAPSLPPGQEPAPPPGTNPPLEGGIGFPLPEAGRPRRDSLVSPPLQVPGEVRGLYEAAAEEYAIPWTLLAGIGMAETGHGITSGASLTGAQGLMQFTPTTFARYAVDGDGDGIAEIDNDADSVASAANYLTSSGVNRGPAGVRTALLGHRNADWYVNDVLFYAHAYGGGTVWGDPTDCGDGEEGNPELPPLSDARVAQLLTAAGQQVGEPYIRGANGPEEWDCSSFVRNAYAHIGISLPRTARAQRDWLAAGNGFRVPLGQERPGDLVFWDSYRGPNEIGHVMLVWNPARMQTVEARIPETGHYDYTAGADKTIFEIWRVGDIADNP